MYVKYLNLLDDEYSEFKSETNEPINLNKINIFIGKNNSGKSRIMRQVLIKEYNKNYYINSNIKDFIDLRNNIEELLLHSNEYTKGLYSRTYLSKEKLYSGVFRNEEDEERLGLFICNLVYSEDYRAIYNKLQLKKIIKNTYSFRNDTKIEINGYRRDIKNKIIQSYEAIIEKVEIIKPNTLFFPAFLSLRKLNNIDSDKTPNYHSGISKMIFNDYFSRLENFNNNIKTGQEIYSDMKRQLLGLNKDREQFLKYEKYISENFFNYKDISIFIRGDDNNIYIKEEGEEPYPIYMLGEGLQTLITITYYLFMNDDKPLKVFIDEPEIHLHPGLQRLLILKLLEYENCQFFISTHSSNLIDICDEFDEDISIICVEKNNGKKIAYSSAYDDMNLYNLIGVRPSSIILSNCTIWVEGPTDIYYIDAFLKLYSKLKNKRQFVLGYNYNYAFNGSINIASKINFDNDDVTSMKIKKLSKNNFIIFDNDNLNKENANYKKIENLKDKLGERCHVIKKLKTIENIILPEILYEYFDREYNSKDKETKPIVLEFFNRLIKKYEDDNYFKKDIADEMAEYINKKSKKKNIKEWRKYCNNLWNSNKFNLAIYFSGKIANMETEKQIEVFNKTMGGFIQMIRKIYKFIEENN